jgi:hypothetical protein
LSAGLVMASSTLFGIGGPKWGRLE